MLIGSKLPPDHIEKTFFSSGRAAFAFLVGQVIKPKRSIFTILYMLVSCVNNGNEISKY